MRIICSNILQIFCSKRQNPFRGERCWLHTQWPDGLNTIDGIDHYTKQCVSYSIIVLLFQVLHPYLHMHTHICITRRDMQLARCTAFYLYIRTRGPRYTIGTLMGRTNVEINCNEYLTRHIFWSTWNVKVIAQWPDHNKKLGILSYAWNIVREI